MNESSINTDWPLSWLLIGVIIAAALSFFYYFREKRFKGVPQIWLYLMAFLRFSALTILFILILGINFKQTIEQKEEPIVVVVQDQSSSVITVKDSAAFSSDYYRKLESLATAIGRDFEVVRYHFNNQLHDGFSKKNDGKTTDIGSVFKDLRKKYTNRNLGAVVIATDGNYNKGVQPLLPLEKMPFTPVYAVALGDTTSYKDTRIIDVDHNEIAFYQNKFPVQVYIASDKIKPTQVVELSCWKNGKKVFSKDIKWDQKQQFKTVDFQLKANKLGMQQYEIRLDTLKGESSTSNNVRSFYIEVVDARQSILIAANAPHPDISTIYQSLLKKKGYELEMVVGNEQPKKELSNYDLVILHAPQNRPFDKKVLQSNRSVWIIATPESDFNMLNEQQVGFKMKGIRGADNIFPGFNAEFNPFEVEEELNSLSNKLPPLSSPFGKLSVGSGVQTLAYQRLGNIVKKDPLWFVTKQGRRKIGVLLGEGIWRWRLYNQKFKGNTENVEKIIGQWAQFLALKSNTTRFRVQAETAYNDQESVKFAAELFDDAFERTVNGVVNIDLKSEGFDRSYTMVENGNVFSVDFGQLQPGVYEWNATAEFNNKEYTKKGSFTIKKTYLEQKTVKANHQILKNMAIQSNGAVVSFEDIEQLPDLVAENNNVATVVHEKFSWKDLLEEWWWMLIVAILFFVEWFLRKRLGAI